MKMRILIILLIGISALTSSAWGPEGHMTVGRIASHFLNEDARARVDAILNGQDMGSLPITCWADFIRRNKGMKRIYPENGRWHYIDIPVGGTTNSTAPQADGNDVISQVERWHAVYADPAIPNEDKRDALRFLIHFMGDMHQPLHCADREGDRGGNLVPVQTFKGAHVEIDATGTNEDLPNLHRIWDEYLVHELMAGTDVTNFSAALAQSITPEQMAAWSSGRALDWATDSHRLAEEHAYRFTDGSPLPLPLTAPAPDFNRTNYIDANTAVVREQLQKAGVRLASLLNLPASPPDE